MVLWKATWGWLMRLRAFSLGKPLDRLGATVWWLKA